MYKLLISQIFKIFILRYYLAMFKVILVITQVFRIVLIVLVRLIIASKT
jgi:hypothetical protein